MDTELYDRLRKERAEAWRRAELYAKYSDALVKGLKEIIRCSLPDAWERETAEETIENADFEFRRGWDKMKKEFGDGQELRG